MGLRKKTVGDSVKRYSFNLRLPVELGDRLERIQQELSGRSMGIVINRSSVIRLVLERALPIVEKELGLSN